jgi:hypothetical protein
MKTFNIFFYLTNEMVGGFAETGLKGSASTELSVKWGVDLD